MFQDRSLWERLRKPDGSTRTARENTNRLTQSILLHLSWLLNTRRDMAPAQMDLGVPDLAEVTHSAPQSISAMARAIKECIEKYEPRLTDIQVTHVETGDDILTLRYQITARIATGNDRQTVWFDTMMDSVGRISLKK